MSSSLGSDSRDLADRIPALDGVRAVAVAMVVLAHAAFLTGEVFAAGLIGHLYGRGDLGVAIFFALSGYLLHRRLIADQSTGTVDLVGYAYRRAARILPAYWLALAFVGVAFRPEPSRIAVHALLAQPYFRDAWIDEFSQSWSIATEVSFYAVLPLLALGLQILRRRSAAAPTWALLLVVCFGVILAGFIGAGEMGQDLLVERWLPARLSNFALGMLLAEIMVHPSGRIGHCALRLAAAPAPILAMGAAAYLLATTPIAGLLTLGTVSGPQLSMKMALSNIVAGSLLLVVIYSPPNQVRVALQSPAIRWLGTISYGIFLWHVPVFYALFALSGAPFFSGFFAPLLAVGVPITIVCATLSYYVLERPIMRWAARRGRSRAAQTTTVPTPSE